ncbi:hypothetical protein LTR37_021067 [Vermiconidia calcicola]|uniref:Uncharacterized protein n=1 Tax=Vermiconidia calcicola TaxID=1690605 RepID=A0ACC3MBD7_9PEZI|nr:hypothetical protein LTR37_021067 [Vermiconidia calcicola]
MPSGSTTKQRLWVLPWGLFPRRVTIYLKEKGIMNAFEVIPVEITAEGMAQPPGKPAGSMHILEVRRPSEDGQNDGVFIFQSIPILEYLEDVYGPESGTPDMRGSTTEERAKVRDCLSVISEATDTFGLYVHNASKILDGMEEQDRGAATVALKRTHHLLSLLEKIADPNGPWLASAGEGPTIVDCVAMSTIQFAREVYIVDLTEGHPRLRAFFDAFRARDSAGMEVVPEFMRELGPVLSVR